MMRYLIFATLFLVFACENKPIEPVFHGYVEGRLVYIAPVPSGRIIQMDVREGTQIKPGQLLFQIDPVRAKATLNSAIAAAQAAQARLLDLQTAGRPEEIEAARQTLNQQKAKLTLARQAIKRSRVLVEQKLAPTERLDVDQAKLEQNIAAVKQATAQLKLRQQPARADQINAARAEMFRLQAQIDNAKAGLDDHQVRALQAARVEIVYRRVGELAGPTQPVLALLRPDGIRIRFFVNEARLSDVRPEQQVRLSCDGCATNLTGKISFIAEQSEFTPPVIFTEKERTKLVWMVEVIPQNASAFRIGQPVEVRW